MTDYGRLPDRGLFITFEGGEGCGKTTQARLLADLLRHHGTAVTLTREPGGTQLGKALRRLLLAESAGEVARWPGPRAEALMFAADRAEHVHAVIAPALDRGEVVISDRYFDSSIVYQGHAGKLQPTHIEQLSMWAANAVVPHLTILLDMPVDQAQARLRTRADTNTIDHAPTEFHEKVRQGFLTEATACKDRYMVLDASRPSRSLAIDIAARVGEMIYAGRARMAAYGGSTEGVPA